VTNKALFWELVLLTTLAFGCTSAQRHRSGDGTNDAGTTTSAEADTQPGTDDATLPGTNGTSDGPDSGTVTGTPTTPVCQPGTVTCDPQNRVVACASNGAAWQTIETCTDAAPCNPNTGTCAVCVPACTNKQCGDNGCGGTCGTCRGEATCKQGLCSAPPGVCTAPPAGTGRMVGQQVKNLSYKDGQSQTIKLHDFCGQAPAIILFETAMW